MLNKLKFEYRISIIYLLIGLMWIFFSDKIVNYLIEDKDLQTKISIIKGFFYVFITGFLLFYLVRRNQKRVLNSLQQTEKSERKFKELFEKHSAVKFIIDPTDGTIIDANLAAAEFYGYSRDQLLNMKIMDINIMDPQEAIEVMDKARKNIKNYFEFKHRKADGSIVDVEAFSSKVIIDGKEYLHSIIHDVTEKRQLFKDLIEAKERAEENEEEIKKINQKLTETANALQESNISLEQINNILVNFQKILENSLNEIYIFDSVSLKFLYANKGALKNIGYSIDELRQITPLDIKPELTEIEFFKIIEPLKSNVSEFVFFETIHQRKDNTRYPVYITLQKAIYDNNEVFVAIILDITEKKQKEIEIKIAKERAEESEKKYSMMVANSPDFIILQDLNGITTFISENVAKITGLESIELIGNNLPLDRIYNEDLEKVLNAFKILQQGNPIVNLEYRFIRKDGEIIWVNHNAVPIVEDGQIVAIQSNVSDITLRKNLELELLDAFNRLEESQRELISSQKVARVGYYILDVPKNRWTNSEMLDELFGIDKDYERSVEGWISLVYEEDKQMMLDYFVNEVIGNRKTFDKQYRILNQKDKKIYWVHGLGTLDFDNDGNPVKMFGTIQDITTIKNYELSLIEAKEKAEESDKLKTAFLQNISHEIRTPLNGILGFSSLLEDEDNSPEDIKEYTSIIRKSGNRLLELVNNILDISRIETGQVKIENTTFSVNSAIVDLISFFDSEAQSKGLQLKYSLNLTDEEALITTDYHKFFQVMTNLIKNAIKFTKEGYINIGYELRGTDYLFYVNDTGTGIPTEVGNKIFERFVQADISITRGYEGAGLGLAICKGFVELLGGKIWFESAVGVGTTFYFTLPNDKVPKVDEIIEEPQRIFNQEKINILIAEDDEDSYLFLSTILKNENYNIILSQTGPQTIELFSQNPNIDLIFMDIQLPGLNGYEVTEYIRKLSKDVIIVAQTAFAHPNDRQKALDAGCNEYISKPYRRDEIRKLLSDVLEKRRKH